MAYAFAGALYPNEAAMLDAIAHDWITAGGDATQDEVRNRLLTFSDAELAADCITEWELDTPPDPDDPDRHSHMMTNYYQASDLEQAFARFRADIEHDMDVEARGDDEMDAAL
jgi:hypothetical protein